MADFSIIYYYSYNSNCLHITLKLINFKSAVIWVILLCPRKLYNIYIYVYIYFNGYPRNAWRVTVLISVLFFIHIKFFWAMFFFSFLKYPKLEAVKHFSRYSNRICLNKLEKHSSQDAPTTNLCMHGALLKLNWQHGFNCYKHTCTFSNKRLGISHQSTQCGNSLSAFVHKHTPAHTQTHTHSPQLC